MKPELIVLFAFLAAIVLLVAFFSLRSRRQKRKNASEIPAPPPAEGIKDHVEISNQPVNPDQALCSNIESSAPESTIQPSNKRVLTPTQSLALQAANENRRAVGNTRAQLAKMDLDAGKDALAVADEYGYSTVKYMKARVKKLEQEGLPV